jgi:7,8-dihydropterin-6-yl-methyl-4-(beta-D-ribofuranosyl)aminobenzene 5'-phosphate synthase
MRVEINEVDKVEILTLQDNYIDLVAQDNSEIIQRAMPAKNGELKYSIRAEHGFSAFITITKNDVSRNMLFDFGFSEDGAAFNAKALNVDLSSVEVLALSHGHIDHLGGLEKMVKAGQLQQLNLVLHPGAFIKPRYHKIDETKKVTVPSFSQEIADRAGINLILSKTPYPLLGGDALFLGEIARTTPFEKGSPNMFYLADGKEKPDPFLDDTGIVFNVKGKGLVVLTGCAHSGIVNTVSYAQKVTGIKDIMTIMGGFHLSGADFDQVIAPTVAGLKAMKPKYIIPTHCTGRYAIMHVEKEMPDAFLLNMSGTKLSFSA